jgi:hypothetical protein
MLFRTQSHIIFSYLVLNSFSKLYSITRCTVYDHTAVKQLQNINPSKSLPLCAPNYLLWGLLLSISVRITEALGGRI